MRHFYLQNSAGERVDLQGASDVWLSNPTGLGAELGIRFADLKSGFFAAVDTDSEPQGSIVGDLTITGQTPYERYRSLANWIAATAELYLVYCPYGSDEFYRQVTLQYLTKTELCAGGRALAVPVALYCLTPWYKASASELSVQDTETVMRCDDTDAILDDAVVAASIYPGSSVDIVAAGHLPAAFELTYRGAITNPVVTLTGAGGKTYGRCALTLTLADGESLILSSRYGDSGVWRRTVAGVLVDVLDKVDLAADPFPHIPTVETCTLELDADSAIAGTATARIYYYYRTV